MQTGDRPHRESSQQQLLAGLVSPAAEQLYERLHACGRLHIGKGPNEIDMDQPAAAELADADLLYGDPARADWVQAVSPSVALPLLLSGRQREIMAAHDQVIRGWSALESLLKAEKEPPANQDDGGDSIQILRDRPSIAALSAEFYMAARHELCTTSTGAFTTPLSEHQLLTPPKSALQNGARYRNIYDQDYASSPAGAKIIELSIQAGEEARIRQTLPTKMLLVDQRVALVALNDTGVRTAALIRSEYLLALLREWFNLVWNDPATTHADHTEGIPLSQVQLHILRLMASGMTDDAIARSSGMSVRTVRRHITSVMEIVGSNTRFAAGVAAAKRGWI